MATNVPSELNANVWKIEVKPGDAVQEEDTLIILESMKMEIPVVAPPQPPSTSVACAAPTRKVRPQKKSLP